MEPAFASAFAQYRFVVVAHLFAAHSARIFLQRALNVQDELPQKSRQSNPNCDREWRRSASQNYVCRCWRQGKGPGGGKTSVFVEHRITHVSSRSSFFITCSRNRPSKRDRRYCGATKRNWDSAGSKFDSRMPLVDAFFL